MDSSARTINQQCSCTTLDPELLRKTLTSDPMMGDLFDEIQRTRPHLFSATTVFISRPQLTFIQQVIASIESVIQLESYRELVLKRAPEIALHDFGPHGVFHAYDFHLSDDGPQLIEINTNAGGALLNAELARAQQRCCADVMIDPDIENRLVEMFRNEWRLQRGAGQLKTILILDHAPTEQYLYPEFLLFQRLFKQKGIEALIAAPEELSFQGGKLECQGRTIDLVYNRLTDFYFETASLSGLRQAYADKAVVITPNPYHHALYAHKHNLVSLSHASELRSLGVNETTVAILERGIPKTELVTKAHSEALWERRKKLFFKPMAGYGSRAAYRGDKLTRGVWEEILKGQYVAQKIVPPSERVVKVNGSDNQLKVDLRAYVYQGEIQLLAARLYTGQTTNFRTSGGGFAPIAIVND
jgi:hypothetical protein